MTFDADEHGGVGGADGVDGATDVLAVVGQRDLVDRQPHHHPAADAAGLGLGGPGHVLDHGQVGHGDPGLSETRDSDSGPCWAACWTTVAGVRSDSAPLKASRRRHVTLGLGHPQTAQSSSSVSPSTRLIDLSIRRLITGTTAHALHWRNSNLLPWTRTWNCDDMKKNLRVVDRSVIGV